MQHRITRSIPTLCLTTLPCLLTGLFVSHSSSDSQPSPSSSSTSIDICNQCPANSEGQFPSWSTQKALASHMRAKHKEKCMFRVYIDADGVCPVCKTQFKSRIRCLAHVSDKRRTKCSSALVAGHYKQLATVTVERLDLSDREERRLAQQSGHSQPIAKGSARTACGRVIGRTSR